MSGNAQGQNSRQPLQGLGQALLDDIRSEQVGLIGWLATMRGMSRQQLLLASQIDISSASVSFTPSVVQRVSMALSVKERDLQQRLDKIRADSRREHVYAKANTREAEALGQRLESLRQSMDKFDFVVAAQAGLDARVYSAIEWGERDVTKNELIRIAYGLFGGTYYDKNSLRRLKAELAIVYVVRVADGKVTKLVLLGPTNDRIKQIRTATGQSTEDFAKRTGLPKDYIEELENIEVGHRPMAMARVVRLACALTNPPLDWRTDQMQVWLQATDYLSRSLELNLNAPRTTIELIDLCRQLAGKTWSSIAKASKMKLFITDRPTSGHVSLSPESRDAIADCVGIKREVFRVGLERVSYV